MKCLIYAECSSEVTKYDGVTFLKVQNKTPKISASKKVGRPNARKAAMAAKLKHRIIK